MSHYIMSNSAWSQYHRLPCIVRNRWTSHRIGTHVVRMVTHCQYSLKITCLKLQRAEWFIFLIYERSNNFLNNYVTLCLSFPTRLLKHYIDDLIVPITAIINLSMGEGVVPPDFKQALVTPLIKKKTLCRNEFKNYLPLSNLLAFCQKYWRRFWL